MWTITIFFFFSFGKEVGEGVVLSKILTTALVIFSFSQILTTLSPFLLPPSNQMAVVCLVVWFSSLRRVNFVFELIEKPVCMCV